MRAFAAELKSRRHALAWSQEKLADECQVNRTFVAKLELAQNQPSLSVLLRIATGLGAELPELMDATMERYAREMKALKTVR